MCINFHLRAFSIYLFYILANSQTLGCIFINKVYHHFLQPGSIYHLPPFSFLKCNDLSKKKVFSQTVFVLCLQLREFYVKGRENLGVLCGVWKVKNRRWCRHLLLSLWKQNDVVCLRCSITETSRFQVCG